MEQGIQDKVPLAAIADSGCYFLCLCQLAINDGGTELNMPAILRLYKQAVDNGWMTDQCFINNGVQIYKAAGGMKPYKSIIHAPLEPVPADGYIIRLERPMYGHFVLPGWDPMNPNRPAAKLYTPVSYRVLRL